MKCESWVRNRIDRYVLARLENENVKPSPAASRPTLIKRIYYDLIGLPTQKEEPTRNNSALRRLLTEQRRPARSGSGLR